MTLRIIDSHVHVWDPAVQRLPWLDGLPRLRKRYTIDDLAAAYDQLGVDFRGAVYVEVDAADPGLENRLIAANPSPLILKRMLRARLSAGMPLPDADDGIREPLHIGSQPRGRCRERDFIEGLELLAARGMPFELCNRAGELPDMVGVFREVPEVTVIIDHMGTVPGPDDASKRALADMAELPNVYVKISGDDPVDPDVVAYVRAVFDPKKLLYASNWPVVGLNSTLADHLRLMRELFGDDEDFFLGNARRAYGIDAVPPERGAD